jgi:hypothetical protein
VNICLLSLLLFVDCFHVGSDDRMAGELRT